MTIGSNVPQSNPLGDNGSGTTNTVFGKVTTGGQNANVDQNEKAQGLKGVAQSEKGVVGENSTIKASQLSADPPGAPGAEAPEISPTKEFKPTSKVNEWLTSTFLSKLSENYAEIAKLGKEIHKAEGAIAVQLFDKIWKMAVQTADLIMAKAQTEANMHLALAISAMVGLAVSVAGTALSVAGGLKASSAKGKKVALQAGGDDVPQQPGKTNDVKAGSLPVGGVKPAKPLPTPPKNLDAPDAQQVPVNPNAKPLPKPQPKPQAQVNPVDVPDQPPVVNQPVNNTGVNQPAAANPNQVGGTGNASNAQPDNASAARSVGDTKPSDPKSTMEQIIKDKGAGKAMQSVGAGMQAAANSVREIIDNIVQMIFKPILAKFDGDIEKSRAVKELASKALDSCIQAFNSGTDIVDGVVRAMEKLNEVIKANSINSRN